MTYSHDHAETIPVGDLDAPDVRFTFSTCINHPDDLPSLTLETAQMGQLTLDRAAVIAWLGKAEVERLESACVPETWDHDEQNACDRADDWRKENAA